jgi:hypothetical protein
LHAAHKLRMPVFLHSGQFQVLIHITVLNSFCCFVSRKLSTSLQASLALPYRPRFHCNWCIILLPVINGDTLRMYLLPTVDALGQRNEDFFAHGL